MTNSNPGAMYGYSIEEADTLIVTLRTGFPHGMAATRRILLIARTLQQGGSMPAVVHMNTSERSGTSRNSLTEGVHQGIPFRYACGEVRRPDSFLSRRKCTLSGFLSTCRLIAESATTGRLKTVVFYERSIFSLLPIMLLCRLMEVSFALDVVEWPVAMESDQDLVGRISLRLYRTVALRLADRVTAISRFLWQKITNMRKGSGSVMYLPILADPEEAQSPRRPVHGRFVISISAGYSRELLLVIEAFAKVRDVHPDAELHITGGLTDIDLRRLLDRDGSIHSGSTAGRGVKCRGYLSRSDLLELFSTSCAAVVALDDDLRSQSRMPTKIADYTFNGIPLVTGGIGDVSRIFTNGKSAFMYLPGDSSSLAEALMNALADPDETERIGRRGKGIAMDLLSFDRFAGELDDFLACGGASSRC